MEFKMQNEDGSEFTVTNTHHALERFQLRFSILYVNIFTKSSREVALLFKKAFYASEPYSNKEYRLKGRDCYYLKSEYLVFVIGRETNLIYTVKCGDGFEDFNTIKDNVRLRKALKKRDYENKKFYFD